MKHEGPIFVGLTLVIGVVMGLSVPHKDTTVALWVQRLSSVMGWTYFAAWSLSFYPQVILNYQRKSVQGLSLDYVMLNIIGFCSYSVYNLFFYADSATKRAYERTHHGSSNTVELNDVFFSLHAVTLTTITIIQIVLYRAAGQTVSRLATVLAGSALAITAVYAVLCAVGARGGRTPFNWLDWLFFLSYLKVAISLCKYSPQVYIIYKRKSTTGWNIWNVLLDITGGVLSICQLVLDCWAAGDWSGITGNMAKFSLGALSIVYDIIFILQHYLWFGGGGAAEQGKYEQIDQDVVLNKYDPPKI